MRAVTSRAQRTRARSSAAQAPSPGTAQRWSARTSTSCSWPSRRPCTSNGRCAPSTPANTSSSKSRRFCDRTQFAEVAAAARRANRQVLVAENYFYKPMARLLRQTFNRGDLGELRLIQLNALKGQSTGDWRDDAATVRTRRAVRRRHPLDQFSRQPRPHAGPRFGRRAPARAPASIAACVVTIEYAEGPVATLAYSWELRGLVNGVRWSACYGTAGTLRFETNGLIGRADRPAEADRSARTERSRRLSRDAGGLFRGNPSQSCPGLYAGARGTRPASRRTGLLVNRLALRIMTASGLPDRSRNWLARRPAYRHLGHVQGLPSTRASSGRAISAARSSASSWASSPRRSDTRLWIPRPRSCRSSASSTFSSGA